MHDESLAWLVRHPEEASTTARGRAATSHVAACADCFQTLLVLRALADGSASAATKAWRAYGCAQVQDDLYALVALDAVAIREHFPLSARHLGWCEPCRGLFAELAAAERVAARGDLGPAIAGPVPVRWKETASDMGRRTWELAGAILAEFRQGVVSITSLPLGVSLVPVPAGAMRGEGDATTIQRLVADGPGGGSMEITLLAERHGGIAIEVRLEPVGVAGRTVGLRMVGREGEELIGALAVRGDTAARFPGLPAGAYVVTVQTADGEVWRAPIAVASEADPRP